MKRGSIWMVLFLMILFTPFSVNALSLSSDLPEIVIEGIDKDNYLVDKTITEKDVIITLKEQHSGIMYSWSFRKDQIKEAIHLNFELNFESPNKEKIDAHSKNQDKLYLSFTHHGTLPSEASMKVFVGNHYANGEKLYLYYYNEEKDQVEYVDHELKVEKGYVSFKIDHCSDYFLTTTIVQDAINNPKSMNYIIMVMVGVILVLVGATIFSTKR